MERRRCILEAVRITASLGLVYVRITAILLYYARRGTHVVDPSSLYHYLLMVIHKVL